MSSCCSGKVVDMARRPKLDDRSLMNRAIEVMHQSFNEPRPDGKATPKVGAVIRLSDGTIEEACRGELRSGDHAEYTLLERKHRGTRLDGATLFTTLEPCAPGARSERKLSCAERIVLARIGRVWIGLEDPDPTVDRKGIKYLQDAGVDVHMFERDLQDEIQKANKDFIEQAMERAAADATEPLEPVLLSPLEKASTAAWDDLSIEAVDAYRESAGISDEINSRAFRDRLVRQGLVVADTYAPTGFGLLLFGREPRQAMPQAGLLVTIRYHDGKIETENFDQPLVVIPTTVEYWLKDKLPNVIDRGRMKRSQNVSLPFELIREAVVNALVHRDYSIEGAKCHLEVTPDTITVKSPGLPPRPITLEQLQSLDAPMLSRNPILHYVFERMGLAEERGLGLHSLRNLSQRSGLPLPTYRYDDPYLVLTLYRNAEHILPRAILEALNDDERKGWAYIATRESTTAAEYADRMRFDHRKAQRHLKHYVDLGLLERVGAGPSTRYRIVRLR